VQGSAGEDDQRRGPGEGASPAGSRSRLTFSGRVPVVVRWSASQARSLFAVA
jgi:hypothetical protein